MSESMEQLESELAGMRLREMSPHLAEQLAVTLDEFSSRNRWSDRLLVFAMSAGAIAACIVVTLLTLDVTRGQHEPGHFVAVRAVEFPAHAYAFAPPTRAWGEILN